MKWTLYISEQLWTQLSKYLKGYPEQNPSSVVQTALAEKLRPKNGSRLLSLTGIVENVPTDALINEKYLIQGEGKTSIAVTINLLFSIFVVKDMRGAAIPIYGNI